MGTYGPYSGMPKGTTQPQWDAYNAELTLFTAQMQAIKPRRENFETDAEYQKAFSA